MPWFWICRRLEGCFVLMACTPAASEQNCCLTSSPRRYTPSDCLPQWCNKLWAAQRARRAALIARISSLRLEVQCIGREEGQGEGNAPYRGIGHGQQAAAPNPAASWLEMHSRATNRLQHQTWRRDERPCRL
ncbi:hypothetical protein AMELA_G00177860 [Ameiurus melas]|uniref:Secreted protein n=1 Tax=Ameiurus melas TaxID=219545 RepID=A0A7J6A9K0_AMEME|nr:hypothetical protein AMELA_G00177860 [Ameiurus melas]